MALQPWRLHAGIRLDSVEVLLAATALALLLGAALSETLLLS
jgi:hypothetical protein